MMLKQFTLATNFCCSSLERDGDQAMARTASKLVLKCTPRVVAALPLTAVFLDLCYKYSVNLDDQCLFLNARAVASFFFLSIL